MKLAFITGITGQDGSYLTQLLLKKDYKVFGIIRRTSLFNTTRIDSFRDKLKLRYGDLSDGAGLSNFINEIIRDYPDFDVFEIYNLAAQSHVKISFEIPEYTADVDGTGVMRLLEIIRTLPLEVRNKVRFYQAGTSELYGKVQETPQNEKTPFYPRSPYAVAKLYAYWITVNYREAYGMYACNGILFNHESPRRGENFITRKITRGLANIVCGISDCLYVGNLDAMRDWGHAKDYVKMQWLMLQQDIAEDFVIATGNQYSVRDFVCWSAKELGLNIKFQGSGSEEIAIIDSFDEGYDYKLKEGDIILKVDKRYFRPTETESLLGDAKKAKEKLGWVPEISAKEMCSEMVKSDLIEAQKIALLNEHGYNK